MHRWFIEGGARALDLPSALKGGRVERSRQRRRKGRETIIVDSSRCPRMNRAVRGFLTSTVCEEGHPPRLWFEPYCSPPAFGVCCLSCSPYSLLLPSLILPSLLLFLVSRTLFQVSTDGWSTPTSTTTTAAPSPPRGTRGCTT